VKRVHQPGKFHNPRTWKVDPFSTKTVGPPLSPLPRLGCRISATPAINSFPSRKLNPFFWGGGVFDTKMFPRPPKNSPPLIYHPTAGKKARVGCPFSLGRKSTWLTSRQFLPEYLKMENLRLAENVQLRFYLKPQKANSKSLPCGAMSTRKCLFGSVCRAGIREKNGSGSSGCGRG